MDQNTNNVVPPQTPAPQQPVAPQSQPVAPLQPKAERKVGPIIGALIIVLVLIIAALYFFSQRLNTEPANTTASDTSSVSTSEKVATPAAPSDDVASIQADLDTTLENVDYSF